ncbi:MAG TPA: phasin family protein [Burkholderiaceae bacterium]
MYPTPSQIAELQKGQVDALNAFGSTLFGATEKFASLNLAATRALLQDAAETAQSLLGAKDAQDAFALTSGLFQPATEKFVSYSRNAYSIASGAGAEISKIVETQIAEGNRKVAELIDFAAKSAPAGAEPAVSLIKSALAASNTAFDTVSKAAKQATEMAESNLAAAAAVANDVVKGKPRKAV